MRKLMSTLAAAALLVGLSAGAAQAREGWYGRADIGYSVAGDIDGSFFDGEETISSSADLDNDWMADIGAGYKYGGGWRSEAELAYRTNESDPGGADIDAASLMVNGFYDFNEGGRYQPYLGLGLGYAQVDAGADDDSGFAWQALAGVGVALTEKLTLDVGYRYFAAPDLDFNGLDVDYTHQAVTVGLRYQFGAPPPPPAAQPEPQPQPQPPAPVACPASEFVVYFEWDRSNLNQAALEVIDQAAARARECAIAAAIIVGHADTSGSAQYNAGLSARRASVVHDAMVARGVSAESITTDARGESDLARPTGDGVREPLNRRTAVTISFR